MNNTRLQPGQLTAGVLRCMSPEHPMTETIYRVEVRERGGEWQFYCTAPRMTEQQAREEAAHRNQRSRSDEYRAVRFVRVETVEVLESALRP